MHSFPSFSFVILSSILEKIVSKTGLEVCVVYVIPSHFQVMVANGLPPYIEQVKTTFEPSIMNPLGSCVINGLAGGSESV